MSTTCNSPDTIVIWSCITLCIIIECILFLYVIWTPAYISVSVLLSWLFLCCLSFVYISLLYCVIRRVMIWEVELLLLSLTYKLKRTRPHDTFIVLSIYKQATWEMNTINYNGLWVATLTKDINFVLLKCTWFDRFCWLLYIHIKIQNYLPLICASWLNGTLPSYYQGSAHKFSSTSPGLFLHEVC